MTKTSLTELELQGSVSHLNRALRREQAEADRPALSPSRKQELVAVNELIVQTLKACKRGSTRHKKGNPAFSQLVLLCRLRDSLQRGSDEPTGKQSTADVLAEIDSMLESRKAN